MLNKADTKNGTHQSIDLILPLNEPADCITGPFTRAIIYKTIEYVIVQSEVSNGVTVHGLHGVVRTLGLLTV